METRLYRVRGRLKTAHVFASSAIMADMTARDADIARHGARDISDVTASFSHIPATVRCCQMGVAGIASQPVVPRLLNGWMVGDKFVPGDTRIGVMTEAQLGIAVSACRKIQAGQQVKGRPVRLHA